MLLATFCFLVTPKIVRDKALQSRPGFLAHPVKQNKCCKNNLCHFTFSLFYVRCVDALTLKHTCLDVPC